MGNVSEIVSDVDLDTAWGNANFGEHLTKRQVVASAVLKCASGYYQGYTSKTIAMELGLISEKYELTSKGKRYLWVAYSGEPLKNV